MPICNVCGKELNNPNSSSHIKSQYHQKALERLGSQNHREKIEKVRLSSNLTSVYEQELIGLKNIVINLEKRINRIEQQIDVIKSHAEPIEEEKLNLRSKQLKIIEKDILNTASKNFSFNYASGNIAIKDLKQNIQNKYGLATKEFEEIILRLYRKQKIDLQPGGPPTDYHLLSPTGKKFYYLLIKS